MNASMKSIRHHLGKCPMLFVAVLVAATVAPQIIGIRVAHADTGGYPWSGAACANSGSQLGKTTGTGYWCTNYNWGEATCPSGDGYCTSTWLLNGYYLLDDWGYGFRNCTSYAAWKINQVFGINNISGWGNASTWDTGVAPPNGNYQPYTVYPASGHTPQVGEIAQWGTEVAGGYGHVAYVWKVEQNGVADLYDYNQPEDGTFSSANTTATGSEGTPDHYIHIGTVPASAHDLDQFYVYGGAWNVFDVTSASGPQIAGDPYEDSGGGVWARDTSNNLRQFYVSNGSWTAFNVSAAAGNVPIASDVSAGSSGEVARGTNGHLYQFYVNGSGAWTAFDISNATTVNISGDPFEDSGGGIWARDTNNHLRQFYVANGSWTAFDVSAATTVNIASDPSVGAGGIFADDTNSQLRQFYVYNGSWTAANLSGATGVNVAGNPVQDSGGGIWIRDVNNHYRQFYVSNGAWVAFDVSGATTVNITGDPGIGSGGNFAEDTNGHLRQFYVSNGSWVAADITSASGGYSIHTNPVSGSGGEFAGS